MPYIKIETAAWLRFADGTPISTPEEYLGWHAQHVTERGIARVWQTDARSIAIAARINHGRWIANCLECDTGMLTHPIWRLACCGECGAVYHEVQIPLDWRGIEIALLHRPKRENQNWEPLKETLDDLQRESLAHGVR